MNIRYIELGFPLCRTLYLENLPFRCPPCLPLCQMSCPVTCLFHLLSRVWCLAYQKSDGSFQSSKPGMASLKPVLKPIVSHFPNGKKKKKHSVQSLQGSWQSHCAIVPVVSFIFSRVHFPEGPHGGRGTDTALISTTQSCLLVLLNFCAALLDYDVDAHWPSEQAFLEAL